MPRRFDFRFWFVNFSQFNDSSFDSLTPHCSYQTIIHQVVVQIPSRMRFADRLKMGDLIAKFFFTVRFFIEETQAQWYFRCTDDVFVNFGALAPFMETLQWRYNPARDFVFLGNCIPLTVERTCFIQGGSGYLISRHGAWRFLSNVARLIPLVRGPEDVAFTPMLTFLGRAMEEATSSAFLGRRFQGTDMSMLRSRGFFGLKVCTPRKLGCCHAFSAPVRSIIFYHDTNPGVSLEFGIPIAEALFSADARLMWMQASLWPVLCRSDNSSA